jgi:hypothetical protein
VRQIIVASIQLSLEARLGSAQSLAATSAGYLWSTVANFRYLMQAHLAGYTVAILRLELTPARLIRFDVCRGPSHPHLLQSSSGLGVRVGASGHALQRRIPRRHALAAASCGHVIGRAGAANHARRAQGRSGPIAA